MHGGNVSGAAGKPGTNVPTMLAPFTRAAHEHNEPFSDVSTQMDAATHAVGPVNVPAYGYASHIVMLVEATGSTTNGDFAGDAPWNVIQSVQLTDVNGAPIVGAFGGYDLYLVNKYGSYVWASDPRTNGAALNTEPILGGGADGDFSFLLRIPIQITSRDALGSLPNQNAASTYKVGYTINADSAVFSSPPGTDPSVRVRMWLEAWTQPGATDVRGQPQATVPPAMGTTQFWSESVPVVASGQQTIQLPRVGNMIRTLIFTLRAAGVRDGADLPDPIQILWDGRIVLNESLVMRQNYMCERYGLLGPTSLAAGTVGATFGAGTSKTDGPDLLDDGVLVYDFIHDLDGRAGNELRDLYLPTTQATRLEFSGVLGSNNTPDALSILTNDVAPTADIQVM